MKYLERLPSEFYLDSIRLDIANAEEDIMDSPVYIILNLCRVLAYVKEQQILSKKEGGEWSLANTDYKYHQLISNTLNCYASGETMNLHNTNELASEYCVYMKQQIGMEE